MNMKLACTFLLGFCTVASAQATRQEIERAIAPVLANPPATGLLIFEVGEGTQAAKAGFRPGDVLTHYDGRPVETLDDLSKIARETFQEQRKLLVLVKRGEQELQAEFDPAPLGVRITPVRERQSRLLWRPETNVEFSPQLMSKVLKSGDHWDLLEHGDKVIGWAHAYLTSYKGRMALRIQSSIENEQLKQQRDVIVTFHQQPYLPLQSIRLSTENRLIFDFHRQGNTLSGERVGVAVSAEIPADAISTYLTGYVAAMMPREKGACLHCSYLADSSLNAAPFSDIYCVGEEELTLGTEKVQAFGYEQTVFGERVAMYWVDADGQVVKTQYDSGIAARRSTFVEVKKNFPAAGEGFPPIERLPNLDPVPAVQAN